MKVFGLWERLTKIIFFKGKQVAIEPATQTGAADKTISVPDMASNASQEMVLSDQAQTLANKTLTSPVVSGTAVTPGAGKVNLAASANQLQITGENGRLAGISTASLTGAKTFTFPDNSGNIVTTGDTGSITSAMIANGTIKDEDISSVPADRIAGSKVSPDFVAQNVVTTGSVTGNSVVVSGSLLGTGAGNALTIGDSDDTITIPGSLIVQGTTTTVDTTNLEVKDKLVTLNNGGLAASGGGTGIEVEENNAVTGYAKVTSDRNGWELKAPNSANVVTIPNSVAAGNVVLDAGTQTIGGSKTFSSDLTLSSNGFLKVPTGTAAQQPGQAGQPAAAVGMIRYNTSQSAFEGYDGTAWSGLGGGGTTDRFVQASPALAVGDVVYFDGALYQKAIATAANTAEVVGVISRGPATLGTNTYELTLVGEVSAFTGLTVGENHFLSASSAGAVTAVEPSVVGQVSVPIGVATSATTMYVKPSRGVVVGGANLRTQIGLSNNATTTIQNAGSYQAGELAGWVEIVNTTPANSLKFYIQAQFALKGAGGDYNLAFQTTGDTPPVGFSMSITSAGLIQVTLPTIAGFASAYINFALNAPAVGATLPLQIASTNVSFTDIQAASSAGITFKEDGGTTTMVITDAGNVGIGTTSPAVPLDVVASNANALHLKLRGRASDSVGQMEFWNNANTTRYGFIGADSTSVSVNTSGSLPLLFGTNTTERMRIDASGNVGIGTASPAAKLHVDAGTNGAAIFRNLYNFSAANYAIAIQGDTSVRGYIAQNPAAGGLLLSSGSTYYGGGPSRTDGTAACHMSLSSDGAISFATNSGLTAGSNFTPTERMRITTTGTIFSLPTYNNGSGAAANMAVTTSGEFVRSTSALKYKEDITPISYGLQTVLSMQPIEYKSKCEADKDASHKFIGFVADWEEANLPALVQKNGEGEVEGFSYDRLTAVLCKAIQEQQEQIEALKAEIQLLKNK